MGVEVVSIPADHASLLASFGLTLAQKREVWAAYQDAPDGVMRCALQSRNAGQRNANSGAGLFLTMIRKADHLRVVDLYARRVTGWRRIRGSHGENYVQDPEGTDPIPGWYDIRPRHVIDATRVATFDDAM
jgi:hypothetical protein